MVNPGQIAARIKTLETGPARKCFKLCFKTKGEAKKALIEINHHITGKKMQYSYWCYDCNAYHLSSNNKAGSRRFKRLKIKRGIKNAT